MAHASSCILCVLCVFVVSSSARLAVFRGNAPDRRGVIRAARSTRNPLEIRGQGCFRRHGRHRRRHRLRRLPGRVCLCHRPGRRQAEVEIQGRRADQGRHGGKSRRRSTSATRTASFTAWTPQAAKNAGFSRPRPRSPLPPNFDGDKILFGAGNETLYCLDKFKGGKQLWKFKVPGGPVMGSPAVVDNRTFVAGLRQHPARDRHQQRARSSKRSSWAARSARRRHWSATFSTSAP